MSLSVFAIIALITITFGLARYAPAYDRGAARLPATRPTAPSGITIPPMSVGSVSFDPESLNCAAPVDFTITILLPDSGLARSPTMLFDGQAVPPGAVFNGQDVVGHAGAATTQTITENAAQVARYCGAGGDNEGGLPVFAVGQHTVSYLDASGRLLAQGAYSVRSTPGIGGAPAMAGSLMLEPDAISCADPAAFTIVAVLPAALVAGDTISASLDGQVVGSYVLGGIGDPIVLGPDGSWLLSQSISAAQVRADCERGGADLNGAPFFTPGSHTLAYLDEIGNVLAEGSYSLK